MTSIASGLRYGLLYGGAWWILGPLTLMPLFLGMGLGVNWNLTAAVNMLPSMMGHLIYGAILGLSYAALTRVANCQPACCSNVSTHLRSSRMKPAIFADSLAVELPLYYSNH